MTGRERPSRSSILLVEHRSLSAISASRRGGFALSLRARVASISRAKRRGASGPRPRRATSTRRSPTSTPRLSESECAGSVEKRRTRAPAAAESSRSSAAAAAVVVLPTPPLPPKKRYRAAGKSSGSSGFEGASASATLRGRGWVGVVSVRGLKSARDFGAAEVVRAFERARSAGYVVRR